MSDSSVILDIDRFLGSFAGREVVYCPNPGNAGDSLIAAATLQLFEKHGIRPRWACPDTIVEPGADVFYGGGGNLVPEYPFAARFLAANHRQAERMVLLPHTVMGHGELIAELGPNVDLIVREPVSLDHCRRVATKANIHLSEDLALSLDVDGLRRMDLPCDLESVRTRRRRQVRRVLLGRKLRQLVPFGRNHLTARRDDCERCDRRPLCRGNRDISDVFAFGVKSPESVYLAARHFMDFIAGYDTVETDRLHVCIGAALMGKEVLFHPNSYFKNEAVYRHSLRERFPLVRWSP